MYKQQYRNQQYVEAEPEEEVVEEVEEQPVPIPMPKPAFVRRRLNLLKR